MQWARESVRERYECEKYGGERESDFEHDTRAHTCTHTHTRTHTYARTYAHTRTRLQDEHAHGDTNTNARAAKQRALHSTSTWGKLAVVLPCVRLVAVPSAASGEGVVDGEWGREREPGARARVGAVA